MKLHFTGYSNGFTAVELLIAIIVGVTMISASYQLYSVGLSTSGDAQRRSKAANVAYDLLRQQQPSITAPCSASTSTPAIPADANFSNASASIDITCPYTEYNPDTTVKRFSNVSLITATISYDSPNTKQVVRAIAATP